MAGNFVYCGIPIAQRAHACEQGTFFLLCKQVLPSRISPAPSLHPYSDPPGSSGHFRHLPAKGSMTRILGSIFRIWECSYWVISPKPSRPTAPGASQPESSSIWLKVALTKAGAAWQKWISGRGPHHHHYGRSFRNADTWDFPCCPLVKAPSFQLKGAPVQSQVSELRPAVSQRKKKKRKK